MDGSLAGRLTTVLNAARETPDARPTNLLFTSAVLLLLVLIPAAAVMDIPAGILAVAVGLIGLVMLSLKPDVATLLVMAIVYSNAAVIAVRFHDVPFALAAGSTGLLLIPIAYFLLIRRQPLVLPPAMPWVIGYLGVSLVSSLLSRDSAASAEAVGVFVSEGLLLYLLVVNAVRTERMLIAIVWVLLGVGAVLGALSIHQEVTQSFRDDYFGFAQVGGIGEEDFLTGAGESRTAGPIGRANRYAQIMVLLLPLVFAVVWAGFSRRSTALALIAGGLITVAIALTLSRGAAVGFALVLATMLVLRYLRWRNLAFIGIALVLLLVLLPQYGSRLATLERLPGIAEEGVEADGSIRSRITETIAAALVFVDHPLIGVGPGQFPTYYIGYAEQFGLRVRAEDREAHNLYFGLASDVGILGSIFFFGAIWVTIRDLARTRARLIATRPRLAHLAAGFMLAIVAYLTTGLFLHLAFERYLWLMLALGAATSLIGAAQGVEAERVPEHSGVAAREASAPA
jgi:putative inorganic carbon (HCO3(-)) transporter